MPHINDCKLAYYESQLVKTGQLNDLILEWLQAQAGVTATQLNDAWNQYFDTLAIPAGQLNDRMYAWLSGLATGETLNDLQHDYYCNVVAP